MSEKTRRQFLTTSAAALAAVGTTFAAKPKSAGTRAERACRVRMEAARHQEDRPTAAPVTNGDEELYTRFTKGLPHDARGEVDSGAYQKLIHALRSGDPADFDAIPMGGDLK